MSVNLLPLKYLLLLAVSVFSNSVFAIDPQPNLDVSSTFNQAAGGVSSNGLRFLLVGIVVGLAFLYGMISSANLSLSSFASGEPNSLVIGVFIIIAVISVFYIIFSI